MWVSSPHLYLRLVLSLIINHQPTYCTPLVVTLSISSLNNKWHASLSGNKLRSSIWNMNPADVRWMYLTGGGAVDLMFTHRHRPRQVTPLVGQSCASGEKFSPNEPTWPGAWSSLDRLGGLRLGPGTGRNRLEWNTFHYSGTGTMVFWPWCWYPSQTINLITRTDWYNRSCWSFEMIQFICYSNLCGFDWRRWLVLIIPCCVRFPPAPQFDCDWWDVRCNITFLHTLTSLPHLHHLSPVLRDKTQLK